MGNTVDVENASYDNSIGVSFLQGFWTDPDFDPAQRAFYYVRVLEIPTPRWTTIDAKIFGVELPENLPASIAATIEVHVPSHQGIHLGKRVVFRAYYLRRATFFL